MMRILILDILLIVEHVYVKPFQISEKSWVL